MKNMFYLAGIILFGATLSSTVAWSHGEDKAGPHGGFITMPGAFHVELVPNGKNQLKLYLLDLQWENPSVLQGSVQITLNNKEQADCKPQDNYFICNFSQKIDLTKKGELKVLAERESQKGAESLYKLPLKLIKKQSEHSSHH